jgi:hypothetical protein
MRRSGVEELEEHLSPAQVSVTPTDNWTSPIPQSTALLLVIQENPRGTAEEVEVTKKARKRLATHRVIARTSLTYPVAIGHRFSSERLCIYHECVVFYIHKFSKFPICLSVNIPSGTIWELLTPNISLPLPEIVRRSPCETRGEESLANNER